MTPSTMFPTSTSTSISSRLALALLLLPLIDGAFVTPAVFCQGISSRQVDPSSPRPWVIRSAGSRDDYLGGRSEDDNTAFDVEAARQRLEALLVGAGDDASSTAAATPQGTKNREQSPIQTTQRSSVGRSIFDILFGPQNPQDNSEQRRNSDNSNNRLESKPPNNLVPPFPLDRSALSVLDKPLRDSLMRSVEQPLTSMELERRQTEISLLSRLTNSDDVLDDLWSVWYHERGLVGAHKMQQVEQLMTNQATWKQAEILIRQLIHEHGTTWAEPMNRLATLYYTQGRLAESEVMCQLVLNTKPWHFGALSGLVMVYASLGKTDLAKQWAARRLPSLPPPVRQDQQQKQRPQDPNPAPLPTNRRRQLWVHTATEQATQAIRLLESERDRWWGPADGYQFQKSRNVEQVFHASENESNNIYTSSDEDENAWQ